MGYFEKAGKWVGDLFTAEDNKRDIATSRDRQLRMANSLNYQPAYASDTAVPYEKTQSPLARAYLESVLTGNNPDTTFSGSPNAQYNKEQQQQSRDAMYGTSQQLQAASAAEAARNPYHPQAPARVIGGEEDQKALYNGRYGKLQDAGIDQQGYADLSKLTKGYVTGDMSDDAAIDAAGGASSGAGGDRAGGSWAYVKKFQDEGDSAGATLALRLQESLGPNYTPEQFNKVAKKNGYKSRL